MAEALRCPECGSSKIYKAGQRYLTNGENAQRYLCRECGYRFSNGYNNSKINRAIGKSSQLCVLRRTKKLEPTTETKTVAGIESRAEPNIKGAIAQYTAKQITLGLSKKTIEKNLKSLRMLQDQGAEIFNPENTFKTIMNARKYLEPKRLKQFSEEPWGAGTKSIVARAYLNFCKVLKIPIPEYVDFHKFKQKTKIPWIPFEEDINTLIHACSRKISVFLQVLKESGARSGEIIKLKWRDVDLERKFININDPEKGSLPRQVKTSDKLVAMLETLPRQGEKVWGKSTLHQLRSNFNNQRNRAAFKLQSKTKRNSLPQLPSLVRNYGIPQVKGHPESQAETRPQKHKQHHDLHPLDRV